MLRLAEAGRREEVEQAALDPTRAEGLLHLIVDPGEPSVLVVRYLLRGSRLGLPTGQDVAEDMGVERLAEAGLQVCVLERGKTYPPGELSSRPPPDANERLGPQQGRPGTPNVRRALDHALLPERFVAASGVVDVSSWADHPPIHRKFIVTCLHGGRSDLPLGVARGKEGAHEAPLLRR